MRAAEYCGHQVTALKKYQDDESLFNDKGSNVNHEKFKELVKLMYELNRELKEQILSRKRNATYPSKTT